jgi:single-stranded DNA-binding protein
MVNEVRVAGTLAKDPVMRDTARGALMTEFTVVVKGVRWDPKAECDVIEQVWVGCVAFEDVARAVGLLGKGTVVHVTGEITQQEVDLGDGKKDRKTKVRALVVSTVRTPPEQQDF